MKCDFTISKKQAEFIGAASVEVLFGGAAGGGKSYGQLIDAFLYALRYKGSKQIIFRRTYPELEKSIIRTALQIYPRGICRYNSSKHTMQFKNGSIIDFGYIDNAKDVYKYQSAEFDVIRFDELTHFEEEMYIYLISRLRGANSFPKQIKSSTNPGGVGHSWVKERFIDPSVAGKEFSAEHNTRIFIPAKVTDNRFLMENDPDYVKRLENLDEKDRRALLLGDWDIFDGQFFSEWDRSVHTCEPFVIPDHWERYRVLDYGLDMLACYFVAKSPEGVSYFYKEIYENGLIISEAARRILEATEEGIVCTIAPPDLWNRRQDTGKSAERIFAECGVPLVKSRNDRVQGWLSVKEKLHIFQNSFGERDSLVKVFSNCRNLIRCIPAVQFSAKNPNDVATEPHELTHSVDALRYYCSFPEGEAETAIDTEIDEFISYGM